MFFLKIVRLLVFSNVFIALCAVGLQLFCLPDTPLEKAAFLFFSVIAVYSFLKLKGLSLHQLEPETTAIGWLQRHQKVQMGVGISALFLAIFCGIKIAYFIPIHTLYALFVLLIYFFFRGIHKMAIIPPIFQAFAKIGMVALVWTIMLLPIPITAISIYLYLFLFVFVLALMIPFEIRDMQYDAPFAVPTVPLLLGIHKAKWISCLLLLFSIGIYSFVDSSMIEFCSVAITTGLALVLVYRSSTSSADLYYFYCIDGLLLMPYVIKMLLEKIIFFSPAFF